MIIMSYDVEVNEKSLKLSDRELSGRAMQELLFDSFIVSRAKY